MLQRQTATRQGTGYLDHASYLPRVGGPGGFLMVRGWFSLIGDPNTPLTATVRAGQHGAVIPCRRPRPDVQAANPLYSLHAGFDATVKLSGDPPSGAAVTIEFADGTADCGALTAAIQRPDQAVEQLAPRLPPLRLRKLCNLILNERERLSNAEVTTALPVTGQIDPAFQCNLECPHCLSEMIRQDGFTMPLMKPDQLDTILATYGDTLVRIWLSLWGEPLLNKNLPDMVARCKRHDIWVLISSNMSVKLSDGAIEALVKSGLDSIVLSVDGASQAVYEKYRRKGDLSLVLDNVRRLVATKRRLNSPTPYLYWRFLTFAWNRHEVDAARAMAAEIGVDEFGVEPGVLTPQARHSQAQRPAAERPRRQDGATFAQWRTLARQRERDHQHFGCDYLHASISVNANGLVHPCCYVVSPAHAVGDALSGAEALRNGTLMRSARRLFAAAAADTDVAPSGHDPCLSCPVVAHTGGHVVTQTSFAQAYNYLVHGAPMGW